MKALQLMTSTMDSNLHSNQSMEGDSWVLFPRQSIAQPRPPQIHRNQHYRLHHSKPEVNTRSTVGV